MTRMTRVTIAGGRVAGRLDPRRAAALLCGLLVALAWIALPPSAAGQGWPPCADGFQVEAQGSSVAITHGGAEYNCCPDEPQFAVRVAADTLEVTETVTVTQPCACICCFDLSLQVDDVAPGTWQLVYRWDDEDGAGWTEHVEEVVVVGTGGGDALAVLLDYACPGDGTSAEEVRSWGALKGIYR